MGYTPLEELQYLLSVVTSSCSSEDPKERPIFLELVSLMSQILENLAGYAHLSAFSKLEAHNENLYHEIEVYGD